MIVKHRLENEAKNEAGTIASSSLNKIPPSLTRSYAVTFTPRTKFKSQSIRKIMSQEIGSLVKVRGIVTRISEVKPLVTVGTYTCDRCGSEVYQEVNAQTISPIVDCPSEVCATSNAKGQLFMQIRGSKLQKFQEMRLQELSDQVPIGHIPRSMTVHVYSECTRRVSPGDHVIVSGVSTFSRFHSHKDILVFIDPAAMK